MFYCPHLLYFGGGGDDAQSRTIYVCGESTQMNQQKLLQLKKYLTKQELQMPIKTINKPFLVPKLERGYGHLKSVRAHNHLK